MRISTTRRGVQPSVFVFVLLLMTAAPAWAQNLLANPGFDSSLSSWVDYGSGSAGDGSRNFAASPEDSAGSLTSGSAQLSLTAAAAVGVQIGIAQCVSVVPGQTYNYGARIKQPTDQASGAVRAMVDVVFFTDAACATSQALGEEQGFLIGTAYALDDTLWRGVPSSGSSSGGAVLTPPGAASAQFRVLIERVSGNQDAEARFDSAFFGLITTPVKLQTFTVD